MIQSRWEHFPHGADIGIRGIAATKEQAFEQAALAMVAVVTDPRNVHEHDTVSLECEAPDDELLLADWLNSLIFEMSTRNCLFARFTVKIEGGRLRATASGEPVDLSRHQPAVEIKGATYTELRVVQENNYWIAQTVVDV